MTRSPRELATQKIQIRKQQETLLRDLLTVVDALDHAADHWNQATASQMASIESRPDTESVPPTSAPPSSPSVIDRLQHWLKQLGIFSPASSGSESALYTETDAESNSPEFNPNDDEGPTLAEVVTSAKDGVDMIRESMMTVLTKHQVVPIAAEGQPFDPTYMNALGQQPDDRVPPNTVIREVVRGYRWQDRVLREAQVIVAVSPTDQAEHSS